MQVLKPLQFALQAALIAAQAGVGAAAERAHRARAARSELGAKIGGLRAALDQGLRECRSAQARFDPCHSNPGFCTRCPAGFAFLVVCACHLEGLQGCRSA